MNLVKKREIQRDSCVFIVGSFPIPKTRYFSLPYLRQNFSFTHSIVVFAIVSARRENCLGFLILLW